MEFLKSVYNVLIGLIAITLVYAVRLLFFATSLIAIITIGYTFFTLMDSMLNGNFETYMLPLTMTSLFSVGYLYLTTLMGIGMADIINMIKVVLSLKQSSKSKRTDSRVGEKGVFKNE